MAVRLGDTAPDFTADTTEGTINFHEWLGDSWGILFSHPKDFTPVCTTELGAFSKAKPEFDKRNTKLIGLSVDSVSSHKGWAGDIEETQGSALSFPLIGDEDRQVADLYDMIHPNANDTLTVRSVFVIGPDKKVKLTLTYPASTGRNVDEILRVLDSLQLTKDYSVATPVNWTDGEDVIIVAGGLGRRREDAVPEGVQGDQAVPPGHAAAEQVTTAAGSTSAVRSIKIHRRRRPSGRRRQLSTSPSRSARSWRLRTLPAGLRGSGWSTNQKRVGTAKAANRSRTWLASSSAVTLWPGRRTTTAPTSSPSVGSGHADDRAVGDRGVLEEGGLDLDGVDVLAAADDDVLGAVDDVDEAVVVDAGDVAGVEPAVREDVGGLFGAVPVAADDLRPLDPQLAGDVGPDGQVGRRLRPVEVLGDDDDVGDGHRRADAVRLVDVVGAGVHRRDRGRLGQAVAVAGLDVGEGVADPADELGRGAARRRTRRT